jgi:hypothetical protein
MPTYPHRTYTTLLDSHHAALLLSSLFFPLLEASLSIDSCCSYLDLCRLFILWRSGKSGRGHSCAHHLFDLGDERILLLYRIGCSDLGDLSLTQSRPASAQSWRRLRPSVRHIFNPVDGDGTRRVREKCVLDGNVQVPMHLVGRTSRSLKAL